MNYFLYDHAGSLNRGCEAILRGTQNILAQADKNARLTLASFRPESDEPLGLPTVPMATRPLSKAESLVSALHVKLAGSEKYALRKMYDNVIRAAADSEPCSAMVTSCSN